jgi:serine/threonine-protein kinase RsbW
MGNKSSHVFPAEVSSLAKIATYVTRAAEQAGLGARSVYAVQMAVDEACSNIIEHAYEGQEDGKIECTCEVTSKGLAVTLCDQGAHFDPLCVSEPDVCSPLYERSRGGLGIYFIRKLMDEVQYEFVPERGNVLTVTKYRESNS